MTRFESLCKKLLIGVLTVGVVVIITIMLMDRVEEIENNSEAYTNRSIQVIK